MKKALYLLAIILGGTALGNAQVTFKPGIRGGLNFSHFSQGNDAFYDDGYNTNNRDFSSKTDFYVGFFGDLKLTKYYSLQPEINYSRQGSTYDFFNGTTNVSRDLEVSYLSIGVANKFTFNKFNVHVGPTIDFLTEQNFDNDASFDLAFILGAGYEITPNFGLEARIKKGIIPVLDYSDGNHTNVVFSVGAFYKFDVK